MCNIVSLHIIWFINLVFLHFIRFCNFANSIMKNIILKKYYVFNYTWICAQYCSQKLF